MLPRSYSSSCTLPTGRSAAHATACAPVTPGNNACTHAMQTKETLTLRASSFGSKCDVSDAKFLKKLEACGITDLVNAFATFKNEKELKRTDGAKRSRITGETLHLSTTAWH